jgi:AmiR/NasT family two-component response regulator
LVAFFHFVQGKEYAGQERALGAAAFASGTIAVARQLEWQHLIEAQDNCAQVFGSFADLAMTTQWNAHKDTPGQARLERMRRQAAAAVAVVRLEPQDSQVWYTLCTERMDAMKQMEDELAAHLRELCAQRIAQAKAQLLDPQAIVASLQTGAQAQTEEQPQVIGPQLERAVLSLVQEQARRLQTISEELDTARAALNERKVVERAKGLLMRTRGIGEEEAYKMLRQTAMNQGRRLIDVAHNVIAMSDYL